MPKLPLRLSGILAQFPDTHFPSVRHSHAQSQEEGHRRPCPTIQMPAVHQVRWSSRSNKASFVISRLRSCDFSSFLPLSFPHTILPLSPRLLRRPELNSRDRFRRFRSASNAFLYSIGPATTSRYLPTPPGSSHLWRLRCDRTELTCFLPDVPDVNSPPLDQFSSVFIAESLFFQPRQKPTKIMINRFCL